MPNREQIIKKNLESLAKLFEDGKAPAAIARTVLPHTNVPSDKWSFNNQLLRLASGTDDARGFKQWKAVGRRVKKGCKAFFIFAPNMRKCKVERENNEGGLEEVELKMIRGFLTVPVFRYEDTEGDALDVPDIQPKEFPPLMDVAKAWGIKVEYKGGGNGYYGYHMSSDNSIALCSHDEQVFFHELSHAAQKRVDKNYKPGQHARQEVAAELSACVLARMVGRKDANEGASYKYIARYADKQGISVGKAVWGVVADVEKLIKAIMTATEKQAA